MTDTLVIGAGTTGLACARRLAEAGHTVLILDKGRGIGGRMATRRVILDGGTAQFDHGAQYVTVKSPDFAALLRDMSGAAAIWADGSAQPHYVGLPGMSGLPRAMAGGLDVRQGIAVTALAPYSGGWRVTAGAETMNVPRVVLTIPAPQIPQLLGTHPLGDALSRVEMAPCLTLMAAFPPKAPRPFVSRACDTHPLAWIAQDSSKPARAGPATTWVAQASPEWSLQHLQDAPETTVAPMLSLLCDVLGTAPSEAIYATVHRWRYARVTAPLGRAFLRSEDASLYLGGDWCLGARVEAAWQSGTAMARDILERDRTG